MEDLYQKIRLDPDCLYVASDAFEDNGRLEEAESIRQGKIEISDLIYGNGNGHGDGYGHGYGYGYGYGYGHGHGDGNGYGHGDGYGDGNGYGDGTNTKYKTHAESIIHGDIIKMDQLVIGNLYLFMAGDGFAWIGRFVGPCGLFGGYFEDNVMICRTGGTSWPQLARGSGRDNAIFESWKEDGYVMPHVKVLNPFPWKGKLPV